MKNTDSPLQEKIANLEKKYGYKLVVDNEKIIQLMHFSSGSMIINRLTGIKGYPTKAIIEIFGQPSTGKTTLALHAIKEFQKISEKKSFFLI